MSKTNEKQLSLDLSVPTIRKGKCTEKKPKRTEANSAQVRSLNEARVVKKKKASARHFREIVKLARHF